MLQKYIAIMQPCCKNTFLLLLDFQNTHYLSGMKTQITDFALDRLRGSNKAMAKLMIYFNRGQWSIEKWMKIKSHKLVEPGAVEILKEELGLTDEQIFDTQTEAA
jgi:hypothetical protein